MTSGWIILARSKPDSDTIGVFVIPPGIRTLTVTSGAVEVLRHNGAERLECGLGWAHLAAYPMLAWRWYIELPIRSPIDERTREGDDHPARLFLGS
jgi:Protein of unknown function (DUF3047)